MKPIDPRLLPTYVPCPTCNVFGGSFCRTKKGKSLFPVHKRRINAHDAWLARNPVKEH